jgi:sugar O-acyltransferase (sialic acid O-acetyltransferase NeuD family)
MKLVVIGAGGHSKGVVATALEAGVEVLCLLDDDPKKWGTSVLGVPVYGPIASFSSFFGEKEIHFVLALGDNKLRRKLMSHINGVTWATLVHPKAYVHPSVSIGQGTVIFEGVLIKPSTEIGQHVIVNTGAIVGHDCRVGDWAHLAPGATLTGEVEVGEGTLLGARGVVIPGKRIGRWSVVGAGSVVTRDIPDFSLAYGVPAKVQRTLAAGE